METWHGIKPAFLLARLCVNMLVTVLSMISLIYEDSPVKKKQGANGETWRKSGRVKAASYKGFLLTLGAQLVRKHQRIPSVMALDIGQMKFSNEHLHSHPGRRSPCCQGGKGAGNVRSTTECTCLTVYLLPKMCKRNVTAD